MSQKRLVERLYRLLLEVVYLVQSFLAGSAVKGLSPSPAILLEAEHDGALPAPIFSFVDTAFAVTAFVCQNNSFPQSIVFL